MSIYLVILEYLRTHFISLLIITLAPCIMVVETNIIPYAFKLIIDIISDPVVERSHIFKALSFPIMLAFITWILMILVKRSGQYLEALIIPKIQAQIRLDIFNKTLSHSNEFFVQNMSGDIANKINILPDSIESLRQTLSYNLFTSIAIIIISLIFTFKIATIFSVIFLIWSVIHILVTAFFTQIIENSSKLDAEYKSLLSGVINDFISNITTVKLFNKGKHNIDYVQKIQNKEVHYSRNFTLKTLYFHILVDIPITIMLSLVIYFLISLWQREQITNGDFILIFNLTMNIIYSMSNLSYVIADIFKDAGKIKQALLLLNQDYQVKDSENANDIKILKGEINFSNIKFKYPSSVNFSISEFNLVIKEKQKIALIGRSGSGKSTIVKLLLRFYDVGDGYISIDNQDIKNITQTSLHKNITIIPQEVNLFNQSILENIAYAKENATINDVIKAAKQAYCHDFIVNLSNGYNTIVGENGAALSGGQKQRISIARAFLKNSPIIIMDEATSALDAITERNINRSMVQLLKDKTCIIIAHKLSTIKLVDKIIYLKQGKIIENGSHKELIQKNGKYQKLLNLQS